MYIRYPHNQEEWEVQKKRNITTRKDCMAEKRKVGANDKIGGGKLQDNKKDKLALAKSFQSSVCSNFLVLEHEAQTLIDESPAKHSGKDSKGDKAQLRMDSNRPADLLDLLILPIVYFSRMTLFLLSVVKKFLPTPKYHMY